MRTTKRSGDERTNQKLRGAAAGAARASAKQSVRFKMYGSAQTLYKVWGQMLPLLDAILRVSLEISLGLPLVALVVVVVAAAAAAAVPSDRTPNVCQPSMSAAVLRC